MAVFTLPKELDPSWPGPGVKPTGKIEIDLKHPLSQGLVGAWLMDKPGPVIDLTGNNNGSIIGSSITSVSTPDGLGKNFNGDGTLDRIDLGSINSSNPLSCNVNNAFSIIAKVYRKSGATNSFPRIFDKSNGGSAANGFDLNTTSTDFQVYVDGSLRFSFPNAGTSDVWSTIGVLIRTGSQSGYIDKALVNSGTVGINIPTTTTNAAIGHWNHATVDREWHGGMEYIYVYNRQLSETEYLEIESNPYQILKPVSNEAYFTAEADDGTTTVITAPANSLWAAVNASINAQTEIATSPPNAVWAAINTSINATTIVSTIPPNSTWVAVNAVIETTAGGATIVTTPPNSAWLGVNASINAKTEIATTPPNSTWAGVNADINASTIIDTSAPNAQWATFATVIEADAVISTTPPNSTWAGINANVLVVSPDADQPTGGWDYPQRPSKKETKKQREELGIIEPDKLIKPVKTARKIPVDFTQIKSLEQAEQQRTELKELQRLHETIKRRGIKKAQKEQLDREVLIKITLALNMLEQQKQLIEEQDIVFVMMMLAA